MEIQKTHFGVMVGIYTTAVAWFAYAPMVGLISKVIRKNEWKTTPASKMISFGRFPVMFFGPKNITDLNLKSKVFMT